MCHFAVSTISLLEPYADKCFEINNDNDQDEDSIWCLGNYPVDASHYHC